MAANGISTLRAGKNNAKMKRQAAKIMLAGAKRCGLTITTGDAGDVMDVKYGVWNHSGGAPEITIAMVNAVTPTMDTFSAADVSRTAGTYTGVTGTTSGAGTAGSFHIVVAAGGAVTSVKVIVRGSDDTVNDTITISDADLGGGGAPDFTMDVATLGGPGWKLNHWFKIYYLPTRYIGLMGDIPATGYWTLAPYPPGIVKDHGNAQWPRLGRPWRKELVINDSSRDHDMPGYP